MDFTTALTVLCLNGTESVQDIRTAFHSLALQYHPDKNENPNSKSMFQQLCQAYQLLLSRSGEEEANFPTDTTRATSPSPSQHLPSNTSITLPTDLFSRATLWKTSYSKWIDRMNTIKLKLSPLFEVGYSEDFLLCSPFSPLFAHQCVLTLQSWVSDMPTQLSVVTPTPCSNIRFPGVVVRISEFGMRHDSRRGIFNFPPLTPLATVMIELTQTRTERGRNTSEIIIKKGGGRGREIPRDINHRQAILSQLNCIGQNLGLVDTPTCVNFLCSASKAEATILSLVRFGREVIPTLREVVLPYPELCLRFVEERGVQTCLGTVLLSVEMPSNDVVECFRSLPLGTIVDQRAELMELVSEVREALSLSDLHLSWLLNWTQAMQCLRMLLVAKDTLLRSGCTIGLRVEISAWTAVSPTGVLTLAWHSRLSNLTKALLTAVNTSTLPPSTLSQLSPSSTKLPLTDTPSSSHHFRPRNSI